MFLSEFYFKRFVYKNDPNKIEIKSGSLALVGITSRNYLHDPCIVVFFLFFEGKKTCINRMLKSCAEACFIV